MRKKLEKILKLGATSLVISFLIISTVAATGLNEKSIESVKVKINGPTNGFIGRKLNYTLNISGGVPPYDACWYWGDGSMVTGGSSATGASHKYRENKDTKYTIAVVVKDSIGSISVDSLRVNVSLPGDSNVNVITSYKINESENLFQKVVVGDILNIKIVVETSGSSLLRVPIISESTIEFSYVNGTANIPPDVFDPGNGINFGPVLYWDLQNVTPGENIIINFDLEVISEFSSFAYLEGYAYSGATVTIYKQGESKVFEACNHDFVIIDIAEKNGRTITVDDSGGANYSKIQDAIDTAEDGDTVLVYPGKYYESIDVDKSIKLVSKDSKKAVIFAWGTSNAVKLSADGITLRGFTIKHAYEYGIFVGSKNNKIFDNMLISNRLAGINVQNGDSNIIKNNYVCGSKKGLLINTNYNLIKENSIKYNEIGVTINPDRFANVVGENTFYKNQKINAINHNYYSNDFTCYSFTKKQYIGNNWDKYEGIDKDGDGLGDTPYVSTMGTIGGVVLDLYPIVTNSNIPPSFKLKT